MKENDKVGISFWARDGRQRAMLWLYRRCWSLLLVFLLILLPLYLFGRLADGVVEEDVFFFDRPILLLARSLANPTLDQVMVTLSRIGYAWGVIPFDIGLLILLCLRKRWSKAVIWALSVGGAALLNVIAKTIFGRVRPDLWLSIEPETSLSFPSGHAMGSMALVAALVALMWPTRWRWLVLFTGTLFVFGVSLSRIYLGVHYPSDILAGWMASLAWVTCVQFLGRRKLRGFRISSSDNV